MSLLSLLGVSSAYATTAAQHQSSTTAGLISFLPMILIFIVLIFFMMRPQMKRAKEHRKLTENLSIGDEIITSGGILGRVTKLRDGFLSISVAKEIEITVQKNSISQVLPKGTLDSLK